MKQTMTGAEHSEFLAGYERIKEAFETAVRNHVSSKPGEIFEHEAMWRAVNDERARLGRVPVAIADVVRVERLALGHSDYSHKFALYGAELAWGLP